MRHGEAPESGNALGEELATHLSGRSRRESYAGSAGTLQGTSGVVARLVTIAVRLSLSRIIARPVGGREAGWPGRGVATRTPRRSTAAAGVATGALQRRPAPPRRSGHRRVVARVVRRYDHPREIVRTAMHPSNSPAAGAEGASGHRTLGVTVPTWDRLGPFTRSRTSLCALTNRGRTPGRVCKVLLPAA